MKWVDSSHYPPFLRVKDEDYAIKFVKTVERKQKAGDEETLGLCDFDEKIIYVKEDQEPDMIFGTVIHELGHAMEHEYKIRISHKAIYQLDEAITQLFKDNF